MKKYTMVVRIGLLALVTMLPYIASAHERRVYQIGAKDYTFIVGFLNEPASVDDKTGVDLAVLLGNGAPTMSPDGGMDGPPTSTQPVEGLEKSLKVEISAGSEKKVFDLAPAFGAPGHYRAIFYPSVETAYTFRIFGAVAKVPVDVTFGCNPSGQAEEITNMVKISDSVTQKLKTGAFTCPASRADEIFPAQKTSLDSLDQRVQNAVAVSNSAGTEARIGIILGALGLIAGIWTLRRRTM